jgi:hypothetical protein
MLFEDKSLYEKKKYPRLFNIERKTNRNIVEEKMSQGMRVRPLDVHKTDDAENEHPIVPSGLGSQATHGFKGQETPQKMKCKPSLQRRLIDFVALRVRIFPASHVGKTDVH